ncbi:lactonase family protein [Sphingomonas nostoxanthinifaciens]|uniref:lactonase family protein n=1 Tax=Sphingomonas nostoxanthinifaciens TaxID=2872652 RepID=UPI001CC1DEED|nr:lactonase family protein [Sphingomonas nostoxanthinifaciens]UAK23278.1 lactonase family protein [Sphingomonas nostoxanthinifaciens]
MLALLLGATAAKAGAMLHAYVGTYTPRDFAPGQPPLTTLPGPTDFNHGRGIYLVEIDATTGAMAPPRLVAETPAPSWLLADPRHDILYAANESGAAKGGMVSAFRIDPATHALIALGTQPTGGAPVSLALDPSGRYLLAANYGGGSVAVFPIRADGSLDPASDVHPTLDPAAPPQPRSPTLRTGDGPALVHMVGTDHRGRFVVANDAAQDRVYVWRLERGRLVANDPPFFPTPRGTFPRHFVFSPDDRHFYNLGERDASLSLSDVAVAAGQLRLTPRQRVSTLPADFQGANQTSELLIARDGRHLYAANRSHDTIAMFAADATGHLTPLGEIATGNDHPRSLAFDPTERFLYSLNQRGDSITQFRVDPKSGQLTASGRSLFIESPAAMAFAR